MIQKKKNPSSWPRRSESCSFFLPSLYLRSCSILNNQEMGTWGHLHILSCGSFSFRNYRIMTLSYFPRAVNGMRQAQKRDGVYNSDYISTCLTTGEKTQATGPIAVSQDHKCPFSQYVEILIIFPKACLLPMSSPRYQMLNLVKLCCVSFTSFFFKFCFKILRIMCGGRYTCHSTEVQTTYGSLLSASTMRVQKIKNQVSRLGKCPIYPAVPHT